MINAVSKLRNKQKQLLCKRLDGW